MVRPQYIPIPNESEKDSRTVRYLTFHFDPTSTVTSPDRDIIRRSEPINHMDAIRGRVGTKFTYVWNPAHTLRTGLGGIDGDNVAIDSPYDKDGN